MNWSLVIGRFWGTEVRLHASLLLLIPYAMVMFRPAGVEEAIKMFLLLAATFACVALHEMGHTAAARMVGITVKSIVLWPLGGVANLSRRPENSLHDMWITAAGPFVNLVIFFLLVIPLMILMLILRWTEAPSDNLMTFFNEVTPFLAGLIIVNLSLVVFNLLPVYPLDGGQITRSLIKMLFGEKRADQVMLVLSLPPVLALIVLGAVLRDLLVIITGALLLLAVLSLNPRVMHGLALGWLYLVDRGGYYLRRQDYDPAIAFYSKRIERRPNASGLYVNRAVCYLNLLDLDLAKRDTDRALELDEKNFVAWALRGELLALEKSYTGALAAYNQSIAIQPQWAITILDRGGLYQEQGDLELALADMNHAAGMPAGAGIANVLRSILHYQMGSLEKARADADQALRYAPQWMLAFPEVFLRNLIGHMEWALDYYGRAIVQMPNAYQAYQGRADAARVNRRMEWAAADYGRAIQREPRQAELYLGRAQALLALGFPEQARADLQQGLRLANRSHIRRQAEALLQTIPAV